MPNQSRVPTTTDQQVLRQAYRNLGPMLIVNAAAVCGAYFALYQWSDPFLVAWLLVHLSVISFRAYFWFGFEREKQKARIVSEHGFRQTTYAAGLCLSGLMWAVLAIHQFAGATSGVVSTEHYALLIILSALAGGATGITSAYRVTGSIYITLLLIPVSVSLLTGSPAELTLGILGLVFWLVMLTGLNANHRVLMRTLDLEKSNLQLIDDLSGLNEKLEAKVSERTARLETLAHTDALTGLVNRHGIYTWWQRRRLTHASEPIVVLFLDLDRFKQINDAMGHDVGDKVLIAVSHQIQTRLPPDAILARWGGDEFVLACPCTGEAEALVETLSAKVSEAVNLPLSIDGSSLKLGVSIGWSASPDDNKSFADVVHAADLAATEVKRHGRGRTLAFSKTFAESLRRRFDLSRALSTAIGTPALYLVYQPIVCAKSGQVRTFEALCRWDHPVLGPISPDEFIRLAEDTDRIVALGQWVLRQACTDAAHWWRGGVKAHVAVNASVKQVTEPNFVFDVVKILSETGLPPARLEIEVTESVFDDEHIERIVETLKNLQHLGIKVHIDDFGTGYSSLSRLKRLSVNAIKIDRSFVADSHEPSNVIIESTLMIARAFGLEVVAEGVETQDQKEKLQALGVDLLQGYLFGRPQTLKALALPPKAEVKARVI